MKRSNLISLILLSILLTGCGGSNPSAEGVITVDVTKSYPEKKFILQDLFDIEYLPLETTDEFVTAGALHAFNNECILMTDGGWSRNGNIYFVDNKSGKYLQTINRFGQGAEEYTYLSSVNAVAYDDESEELYVNDAMTGKILVYDQKGNFKQSLKAGQDVFYKWLQNFDRNHLICYSQPVADPGDNGFEEGANNSGFMLVSKQDGSCQKITIPHGKLQLPMIIAESSKSPTGKVYATIMNTPLIPCQDDWLLVEISADTIYRYSQDHTKKPVIVRTPSVESMEPKIYLYPGVVTDRYYFLQTIKKEFDMETATGFETADLVYDRKENSIYSYIIYNNDFTDESPVNLVWSNPS